MEKRFIMFSLEDAKTALNTYNAFRDAGLINDITIEALKLNTKTLIAGANFKFSGGMPDIIVDDKHPDGLVSIQFSAPAPDYTAEYIRRLLVPYMPTEDEMEAINKAGEVLVDYMKNKEDEESDAVKKDLYIGKMLDILDKAFEDATDLTSEMRDDVGSTAALMEDPEVADMLLNLATLLYPPRLKSLLLDAVADIEPKCKPK